MPLLTPDTTLVSRLIEAIERDVVPLTEAGVARGNKVFEAALTVRYAELSSTDQAFEADNAIPLR